jgi:hypothetical protein
MRFHVSKSIGLTVAAAAAVFTFAGAASAATGAASASAGGEQVSLAAGARLVAHPDGFPYSCVAPTSGDVQVGELGEGAAVCPSDLGYELVMQADGNLVIYNSSSKALWASNTDNQKASYAIMQSDGNFVVYDGSGATWSTRTNGHPNATACFQNDGNLVIYAAGGGFCSGTALWASGT